VSEGGEGEEGGGLMNVKTLRKILRNNLKNLRHLPAQQPKFSHWRAELVERGCHCFVVAIIKIT